MVTQSAAKTVPRLGGIERFDAAREYLDLHFRDNREALVRAIIFEPRDRIAESIHVLTVEARLRIERQRMLKTALKCKIAGLQVQQMMRVHDVTAVLVYRLMAYRVARHADTARKSKSMCEKCCEVSCSESCAEANINCLRCCDRV